MDFFGYYNIMKYPDVMMIYGLSWIDVREKNKMKPTNPNAHTYVNGTDVKTHGYAITQNTFLQ